MKTKLVEVYVLTASGDLIELHHAYDDVWKVVFKENVKLSTVAITIDEVGTARLEELGMAANFNAAPGDALELTDRRPG